MTQLSNVERTFVEKSGLIGFSSISPYVVVNNFPQLGFISALRFLEWVYENPNGVVSLPTGKTPEYFIKWLIYLLENWGKAKIESLRKDYGLLYDSKPDLRNLKFVQIDEFFPIDPQQANSFYYYVKKYYINSFGLNTENALLINCNEFPLPKNKNLSEIFVDNKVDLSLRFRNPRNDLEEIQKETIEIVDEWCSGYEMQIREMGGIGFFLGGIGPDGHIAFNVSGSDHNSTTRLTETNFETQAAAAIDLGGIEISRQRLVITIGLSTITYNPECVAIIMAAGESKADIVFRSIESVPTNKYPATVLQSLRNSRFFLTKGAASKLSATIMNYYKESGREQEKKERSVIDLCIKKNKYGHHLMSDDINNDQFCSLIQKDNREIVSDVLKSLINKINRGVNEYTDESFLHTAPHHDDIMLGYLPHIIHLVRSPKNVNHFAIMTSGFTSVTNDYIKRVLSATLDFIIQDRIEMIQYDNFYSDGYKRKRDKDVYHYLDRVAARNEAGKLRGLCHRTVRAIVEIFSVRDTNELISKINDLVVYLNRCYDGEKNIPEIQTLKGVLREFEEELVWAHYGVQVRNVHHLRLGFYTGDIFTEIPDSKRDVEPILNLFREVNPTVITLAFDPEGSGPDTHYKVLQAIAEAVRRWSKENDLSSLKIWGYRNVWYRFHPAEADIIVPVSLNSIAVLDDTFKTCYLSQKEASFPSYDWDGPFSELTQKIWVDQHEKLELVLGRDFWYQNEHPRLRAAHGVLYLKEMDVETFLGEARRLEKSMEGQIS